MNTNTKVKEKYLPEFLKAIEFQILNGGERYALTEDMDFTDLVCMAVGNDWIGGNIIKYVGEIKNAKRLNERIYEQGFFKIAAWAFIYWLREHENLAQKDKGEDLEES